MVGHGVKVGFDNPGDTGLCRTLRIQVTRRALAQDGSQSLYPWSLGIVNGFAKASSGKVAGSFFEAKGSFQPVSDLTMRFADLEFYRLFRAIHEAIDRFTMLSSMTLIPAGLQRLEMEQAQKKESMNPGYGQYAS